MATELLTNVLFLKLIFYGLNYQNHDLQEA